MITIENVTPQQLAGLEAKLALVHGVATTLNPDGLGGAIVDADEGVSAGFSYAPDTGLLTVVVTKHKFFQPLRMVEAAIEQNIRAAIS